MAMKNINYSELDKNLPADERKEWNAIYASCRSGSIITGTVQGVDFHTFDMKNPTTGEVKKQEMPCLIAIRYKVKIIIPQPEVWFEPREEPHLLRSMVGGKVEYVITHVDRENEFAVASRKLALKRLRFASRRLNPVGQTVDVKIVAVGKNVCTVSYNGYDALLSQKDISYSIVGDLREVISPGEVKTAVVTEWDPQTGTAAFSIKAATRHPFDGIEIRHPIGSVRVAAINGKYNGGVYCRLFDGMTDILCTYDPLICDEDFDTGNVVEILIKKYNAEKKLAYGKILRKIRPA